MGPTAPSAALQSPFDGLLEDTSSGSSRSAPSNGTGLRKANAILNGHAPTTAAPAPPRPVPVATAAPLLPSSSAPSTASVAGPPRVKLEPPKAQSPVVDLTSESAALPVMPRVIAHPAGAAAVAAAAALSSSRPVQLTPQQHELYNSAIRASGSGQPRPLPGRPHALASSMYPASSVQIGMVPPASVAAIAPKPQVTTSLHALKVEAPSIANVRPSTPTTTAVATTATPPHISSANAVPALARPQVQASSPRPVSSTNTASRVASPLTTTSMTPVATKPPVLGVKRESEEFYRMYETKRRFKAALEIEQQLIIKPNYRTPFRDMEDVLDRLMPYHLFTYPEVTDKPGGMAGFDRAIDNKAHELVRREQNVLKRLQGVVDNTRKLQKISEHTALVRQACIEERNEVAQFRNTLENLQSGKLKFVPKQPPPPPSPPPPKPEPEQPPVKASGSSLHLIIKAPSSSSASTPTAAPPSIKLKLTTSSPKPAPPRPVPSSGIQPLRLHINPISLNPSAANGAAEQGHRQPPPQHPQPSHYQQHQQQHQQQQQLLQLQQQHQRLIALQQQQQQQEQQQQQQRRFQAQVEEQHPPADISGFLSLDSFDS